MKFQRFPVFSGVFRQFQPAFGGGAPERWSKYTTDVTICNNLLFCAANNFLQILVFWCNKRFINFNSKIVLTLSYFF